MGYPVMQRFLLLIFATFAFLSAPATAAGAAAEMWRVSQKSGDVRVVHNRLQPAAARIDAALSPGDVVMTGATGRATLTRGGDYIVIAPSSRLLLPANAQQGGWTSLIQEMGTMLFKVRSTGKPHFRVDTPMLAAVVKGTTFTVVVGPDRSAVQVIEGAVEVSAVQGGMSRLVEGGKTVFIANDNPSSLITADGATLQKTSATPGTAVKLGGSGDVGLATVASLTDGLVRADLTAAPAKPAVATTTPIVASAATTVTGTVSGVVDGVVTGVTNIAAVNPVVTVATGVTSAVTGLAQTAVTGPVGSVVATVVPTVANVAAPVLGPIVAAVTAGPTVTVPTITVPTVTVPTVTVPAIAVPTITAPVITAPVITAPVITAPVIIAPVITVPTITVPVVPCLGCR